MVRGPVREDGLAVNIFASHRPKHSRIVGAVAMVAHYEILIEAKAPGRVTRSIEIAGRHVRLVELVAVQIKMAVANFHGVARHADHALDERFRPIERIPENDHVAALNRFEVIDKLVDENPLLIAEQRSHAGAFYFYRLIEKNDDEKGQAERRGKIARPAAKIALRLDRLRGFHRCRRRKIRCFRHLVPYFISRIYIAEELRGQHSPPIPPTTRAFTHKDAVNAPRSCYRAKRVW